MKKFSGQRRSANQIEQQCGTCPFRSLSAGVSRVGRFALSPILFLLTQDVAGYTPITILALILSSAAQARKPPKAVFG